MFKEYVVNSKTLAVKKDLNCKVCNLLSHLPTEVSNFRFSWGMDIKKREERNLVEKIQRNGLKFILNKNSSKLVKWGQWRIQGGVLGVKTLTFLEIFLNLLRLFKKIYWKISGYAPEWGSFINNIQCLGGNGLTLCDSSMQNKIFGMQIL